MIAIPSFVALCAAGVFASPHEGVVDACELQLRDGSRRLASTVAFAADGDATVSGADGGADRVALDDLVEVTFPGAIGRAVADAMTLRLHDGSRLFGKVVGGDDEQVQFELAVGGTLALPLDAVRAVFAGPRHSELEVAAFAVNHDGDTLHRRLEVGGDHTRGTVVSFAASGVRFEYSLGTADFAWSEVEAIVLEQQVAPRLPRGRVVEADLLPDGTLIGELVRLSGSELVLRPLSGEREVALPRAAVAAIRLRAPGWRWLSDLEPSKVVETPYLGGPGDFFFPWRRDRSVTGLPLRSAGHRFGKGFGCHSRCELSFALSPASRRFVATVGLCDEVLSLPERGAVEFRVLVDGVERWKSRLLRGGDEPQRIEALDVSGGKVLTLVADFGSGEDVADRACIGDALLLD